MDARIFELAAACARSLDVDPDLVFAIVMTESSGNPFAIRYEPQFYKRYVLPLGLKDRTEATGRAISWGLMQVMGQVARERGFDGKYLSELCDPETGLYFGVLHLKGFFSRYGDETRAIASYNAGSPRFEGGALVNQSYVDKVLGWRRRIQRERPGA